MEMQELSSGSYNNNNTSLYGYRVKRTVGRLRESNIICIVTHMSPLKTNTLDSRFELLNLRLFFMYIRSSNAAKARSLAATIMT